MIWAKFSVYNTLYVLILWLCAWVFLIFCPNKICVTTFFEYIIYIVLKMNLFESNGLLTRHPNYCFIELAAYWNFEFPLSVGHNNVSIHTHRQWTVTGDCTEQTFLHYVSYIYIYFFFITYMRIYSKIFSVLSLLLRVYKCVKHVYLYNNVLG